MSFNWTDFFTLAERLVRHPSTPGPDEASLRTAISRAYYAVFCSARILATTQEGLTLQGTGDVHNQVIAHFRFAQDKSRRDIGLDLRRLRRRRNQADYESVLDDEPKSLAQSSVDIARNILNALHSLDTENANE